MSREKKEEAVRLRKVSWQRRKRERSGRAGAARREEEPAGASGTVTRKAFGSFGERGRLNGARRLDKGLTWREKIIINVLLSSHRIQNIEYTYTLITLKEPNRIKIYCGWQQQKNTFKKWSFILQSLFSPIQIFADRLTRHVT